MIESKTGNTRSRALLIGDGALTALRQCQQRCADESLQRSLRAVYQAEKRLARERKGNKRQARKIPKGKRSSTRKKNVQFCGIDVETDQVPGKSLKSYRGPLVEPELLQTQ